LASATRTRLAYLDNLKVILVAGVIFGHAWAGYDQLGSWAYTDARETSIAPVTETVLEILLGPFGLFAMGFFLLIAGTLTPGSVSRKGSGRFARDRLLRLGIPLVVFTYVLWPPMAYLMDRVAHRPYRFPWTNPDPEHLWFLEVLLLFSLGFAVWYRFFGAPRVDGELRLPVLLWLAAGVAVATFLVRLRFPLDSTQFADLHLWQWPQYVALFALGLLGRLDPVPDRLLRVCGIAALVGVLGIAACAGVVALRHVPPARFFGGFNPAALVPAAAEGLLAVTVSVWLLGLAQRHLNRPWDFASRGAYVAFLVQGHVLVGLALLLRPVGVPAEVKGLAVSVLGVVLCFGLGWLSAARTPLGRLL
jgi:peptidoglycan/LPS O-acetylase OafA/YrhL